MAFAVSSAILRFSGLQSGLIAPVAIPAGSPMVSTGTT